MNLALGVYNSNADSKRTPLGIEYFPFGLDDYGPKRIRKKGINKMVEAGVEPYIIEQFRTWATALPENLPAWLDERFESRMAAWRACVGKPLPNGRLIDAKVLDGVPGSFKVFLHPEPFPVMGGQITCGASYPDRIDVVAYYLGSSEGVPNSWLRKCDDLFEWEIGNLIGIRHGYSPTDVSQEIGSRSPCQI